MYKVHFAGDENSIREMGHAVVGSQDLHVLTDHQGRNMLFPVGSTPDTVWECIDRGVDLVAADSMLSIDPNTGRPIELIVVVPAANGESYL